MNKEGFLFVVSAPSGAGKSTLIKKLMTEFPQLKFSVSTTTRKPRAGEIEGKDYHFTDKKTFEEMIKRGEFAEWAHIHGNMYGTSLKAVNDALDSGFEIILDIDVQGGELIRKAYGNFPAYVFIAPPSLEVLENRLRQRGTETEENINIRMNNARKEMEAYIRYDYIIINDDLETAYNELKTVYSAYKLRTHIRKQYISENFDL